MMIRQQWAIFVVALCAGSTTFAQQDTVKHEHSAEHSGEHATEHAVEHAPEHADLKEKAAQSGPHGGTVTAVGEMNFETVVESGGIRIFASDAQGQPLELSDARGVATLQLEENAKRYRFDLFPESRSDHSAPSLVAAVDLRHFGGQSGTLRVQIDGLQEDRRNPTKFEAPFVGPLSEAQRVAAATAEQKVCPVSGEALGSMGEPIPVTVGLETIYVCCAGCVNRAKANFTSYLEGMKTPPQLVAAPAMDEDAQAIEAQKVCPVMDEPLGSMGTPVKVTGLKRDIFLCCKGCVKFVEQEPEKYLAKLPAVPLSRPAEE